MSEGAWYVKDFADGWIKFYDDQSALEYAKASGAAMVFSYDDLNQRMKLGKNELLEENKKMRQLLRFFDDRRFTLQSKFDLWGPDDIAAALREKLKEVREVLK